MWTDEVRSWLTLNERSRNWLARKADTVPDHLNRCLTGEKRPSIALLERLAAVMGMELKVTFITSPTFTVPQKQHGDQWLSSKHNSEVKA